MQRYSLGIIVVWWTLLGMAFAAEQPQLGPAEMVHVGQRYFVRYCSACHGVEGRGDGPAAPALRPPPADLTGMPMGRGAITWLCAC
jgi:mono/diheme cytochrome c family protein